jgi:RimJ/RimL family protein N-acetyltransferase
MIDFKKDYILENNIVKLTPLKQNDFDKIVSFSINEPELWTHSLIQANSPEKMKTYFDKALDGRKNKNSYAFLVYDKRKNKYAGSTRFYDIQVDNASLQLGFTWYGKEFQGTGINKNCKYLLLEFAFDVLKMERVEFRADNENQRSINAMKSIGCFVEGVLRSNTYKPNGTRRDSIVLSILKDEWNNTIKNELIKNIQVTNNV